MILKKEAFTLAEVLITLGIIGIVAAMTMPAVINKYNDYVVKTQFKRVYNELSNAFILALEEDGGSTDCSVSNKPKIDETNACYDFFVNKMFKHLNVVKKCEKQAYINGCVPNYSEVDLPITQGCGGFSANYIKNRSYAVVLNDGAIVFTYAAYAGQATTALGFDVNGFKKPNRGLEDIFSLGIDKPEGKATPILGGWNKGNLTYCLPWSTPPKYFFLHQILN